MSWFEHFHGEGKKQTQRRLSRSGPTQINGICEIPIDAFAGQRFQLVAQIENVSERTTKTDETCYFLNCRDAEGMTFTVVCWEWQWPRIQEGAAKGGKVTLDVKVPKEGFSAFTFV